MRKQMIEFIAKRLETMSDHEIKYMYTDLVQRDCQHSVLKQSGESMVCANCNKGFGWHCPDSEDNLCHYYSDFDKDGKRFITFKDGTVKYLPEDHDSADETEDSCIFCQAPDERK